MKNVHLLTLERPCRADKTDQGTIFSRQGSSTVTLKSSYETAQFPHRWSFSPVQMSHIHKKVFFFLFLFDKLQVSCPPGRNWLRQQNWKYLTSALSIATSTNGICVENKSVLLHILFASTPCGYWHLVWKYIEWIGSSTKEETLTSWRISVLWFALTSECPHPEKYKYHKFLVGMIRKA